MTEVPEEISVTPSPADKTAVFEFTGVKQPRKFKKILRKISHYVGIGGNGTSLIDRPRFGKLTWRERQKYAEHIGFVRDLHRACFRKACINVLGEDPETDWE